MRNSPKSREASEYFPIIYFRIADSCNLGDERALTAYPVLPRTCLKKQAQPKLRFCCGCVVNTPIPDMILDIQERNASRWIRALPEMCNLERSHTDQNLLMGS